MLACVAGGFKGLGVLYGAEDYGKDNEKMTARAGKIKDAARRKGTAGEKKPNTRNKTNWRLFQQTNLMPHTVTPQNLAEV